MLLASLAVMGVWIWVWNMKVILSPLQGDALCFVPAAKSLMEGRGLHNQAYHPGRVADPQDPTKLNWHGPVAPYVWAWLARGEGYIRIKIGGARTAAIGLLAMLVALLRRFWKASAMSWQAVWMPAWIILGSGWIFTHQGRPENVAAAAAMIVLAVLPASLSTIGSCVVGAGLGVVVATAPAAGMLMTPLVMLAVTLTTPATLFWKRLLVVGGVALAACGLLVSTLGFGLREWVAAMSLHGGEVIAEGRMSSLKPYWLWLADSPLLVVSLLALAACGWWCRSSRQEAFSGFQKLVIAGALLMLVVAAFVSLIRIATNYYNILPVLACLIVLAAGQWLRRPVRAASWALVLALAFPLAGLTRSVIVLRSASVHGLSFGQAKEQLAADLDTHVPKEQTVAFSHALFELTDTDAVAGREVRLCHDMDIHEDWLVMPQAGVGRVEPPALAGFRMVTDRYARAVPGVAGLVAASNTGAYGYAIYAREK